MLAHFCHDTFNDLDESNEKEGTFRDNTFIRRSVAFVFLFSTRRMADSVIRQR